MESVLEYLRKRATSTLLVSYSVFWCIYHWQGIYVTLFVSQDNILSKYHLLKNEYVDKYFFGLNWNDIFSWHDVSFVIGLLIPGALACIYVWWFPKWALNPAYRKEIKYKIDRKVDRLNEEKRLNIVEAKVVEKKTENVTAELELAKRRAEAIQQDPSLKWEEDYKRFMSNDQAVEAFDALLECVYDKDGNMSRRDSYNRIVYNLSADAKMYADTWGLAKMEENKIYLTDEGRYFAKQYKTETKQ